jgi:hypothetical protein
MPKLWIALGSLEIECSRDAAALMLLKRGAALVPRSVALHRLKELLSEQQQ